MHEEMIEDREACNVANNLHSELTALKDKGKETTSTEDQEGHIPTVRHGESCHPLPTSVTPCLNEKQPDVLATDDTFFCNPAFLEEVEHIESIAMEKIHHKIAMDFTPPSFSLGLTPDKEQSASHSADICPTRLKFSMSPKGVGTAAIAGVYYERTNQATKLCDISGKTAEIPNPMQQIGNEEAGPRNAKAQHVTTNPSMNQDEPENQPINKGKEVVLRQQTKRIAKETPYQCRSPFLKDHREARDRLKPSQLMLVDSAFLPPNDVHPATETLFEFQHKDEDKRLWIFREGFATMAGANEDLESSIVDVLCLILNWLERRRNPTMPKRMFFSTNVFMALQKGSKDLAQSFKRVMDLETGRYSWINLDEAQLVFFPILRESHFFVLCFDFMAKKVLVIDNRLPEKVTTSNYRSCAMSMEEYLRFLRSRYAAMILQSELNALRDQTFEAAKREFLPK